MDSTEYCHSKEFPSELWENSKCPTQFRPRLSKHASIADEACWDVRDEMVAAGGSESITRGVGCVDPVSGNAMAVWFPEALPERLYIASYMIEFAFMHDDLADSAETSEKFDESNKALIDSLESTSRADQESQKSLVLKSMQARFAVEALEIDETIGTWLLQEWKRQFSVGSEERDKEYKSIEQYLKFRIVDAGAEIFLVLMRFVSDTTISRAEVQSVKYISDWILNAQILYHDYVSWQKEIDAYNSGEASSLVNALSVLMKIHDVDEESAKKLLWDEILEYERRYCEERDLFIEKNSPGPEFHRWFRLLELSTGGNAIWSFTTARYNKSAPRPVRGQKTNKIAIDGNAANHPKHKSPDGERPSITNGATTNGKENLKSTNGVATNGKVTHAREAEEDDEPKSKRSKANGTSADNGNHNNVRKHRQGIQDELFSDPDEDVVTLEPYTYISSLPAKGARDQLIDALNIWYHVPDTSVATIRHVVAILHNVSLMLDDIQDNSPMRRGSPATHIVFGVSQTINAATYMYTKGLEAATALSPKTVVALFDELKQLHIGQAHDLHETYHCKSPSVPEYFKRIEQKTGGLFRMASKMMQAEATKNMDVNIDTLMNILGRYYQIRDDYQDITGTSAGKSPYYGDLDQGSFTLPIIHALKFQDERGHTELLSIFQARKQANSMSPDLKKLVIKRLEDAGSLDYTKGMLDGLHKELKQELGAVEERAGGKNWILRLMLYRLKM